jgi:hypothetical protein
MASPAFGEFFMARYTASGGAEIEYRLTQLQPGDAYVIAIGDNELASGVNESGDTVSGSNDHRVFFKVPNLGDSDHDATITATVTRDGEDPIVWERTLHYLAPAPAGTTTQQQGTTQPSTPRAPAGPARLGPTGRKAPATSPKGTTGTPKQNAKKKSKSTDSPAYVAPTVGTPSSSGGSSGARHTPLPSSPFPSSSNLPSAPGLPLPGSAPPPGIAGSGGPLGTPTPLAPAPVAGKGGDGNKLNVPIWLIVLLGAVMFGGLGGAEARLLGLWGTPPVAPASSPDEARLNALTRAAQASAGTQQAIAARKGIRVNGAAVKPGGANGAPAEDPRRLEV